MNELDALRLAVQELYGWLIELDPEPASIEDYLSSEPAAAARVALGPLWPASAFVDEGPKGPPVEQQVRAAWDVFERATEARLHSMFEGVPR
jgi:hypothetical protein